MLLSHCQAESFYKAMRVLDNVRERIRCTIQETVRVQELSSGSILLSREGLPTEYYSSRENFVNAYGLWDVKV